MSEQTLNETSQETSQEQQDQTNPVNSNMMRPEQLRMQAEYIASQVYNQVKYADRKSLTKIIKALVTNNHTKLDGKEYALYYNIVLNATYFIIMGTIDQQNKDELAKQQNQGEQTNG